MKKIEVAMLSWRWRLQTQEQLRVTTLGSEDVEGEALATLVRRSYSTHPRVQKAFRRLVDWKKFREQQNQLSKNTK